MPPRWQPSLEDFIDIAAYLLGADRAATATLPRITLAESALHAPFASFGGTDAYPTPVEQAAVLLQHLAKNHPLPDANKRAAFLLTARFLDANGLQRGDCGAADATRASRRTVAVSPTTACSTSTTSGARSAPTPSSTHSATLATKERIARRRGRRRIASWWRARPRITGVRGAMPPRLFCSMRARQAGWMIGSRVV